MNYRLAYAIGFHPWEDLAEHPPFAAKLLQLVAREETGREPPYGPALDLGTGSAVWGVQLAQRGWRVTGVDIVEKALRRARERIDKAGAEMRLVRGDATALRRADVRCRVLVTSSAAVYAASEQPISEDHTLAPASPYALSKLAQEELARRAASEDGLDIVIARAFNHTGPRQTAAFVAPGIARQIALIETGTCEPIIRVGNIAAKRDITDVRDVVRAYAALMTSGVSGMVYNVASGTARSIRSLLDELIARSKVPVQVETEPARMRPNDVPVLVGDSSRLERATGWRPTISFDRMLDDLLAYWRQQNT